MAAILAASSISIRVRGHDIKAFTLNLQNPYLTDLICLRRGATEMEMLYASRDFQFPIPKIGSLILHDLKSIFIFQRKKEETGNGIVVSYPVFSISFCS